MIKKVKKAIQKYGMLDMGDRVIVAVSGGKDSMALLKFLDMISGEFSLTLIAAHLNHGIRGDDADREETFVRQFSHTIGIEFESRKIHVPSLKRGTGKSIEDIGREERYRFLRYVAQTYGAQKIALGHHLHDQAETVIMNFLRGSGTDGLKGMLPVRDSMFIRPLLFVRKEEIGAFMEEHQIPYMMDSSNDSNIYLRNRIRHSLIPALKTEFNPRLEENLSIMAEIFRLENDYMKTVTGSLIENGCLHLSGEQIKIKRSDLRNQHPAIQNRMIKNLLEKFSTSGKGIGYVHITAVIGLADSDMPGGRLNLPSGIHVWCEYDWLCFGRQDKKSTGSHPACQNEKTKNLSYNVSIPDAVNIQELGVTMTFDLIQQPQEVASGHSNIVYMDYEKIIPPLVVRTIRPGDRIQPLGMEGTMKLKSYFIDRKVPKRQRGETILLVDGKSVVWIAGMRLSERVKITNKSRKFLKVEIV
ncbi:MAG: tRNA lysidine(34) synthetase TilS [Deltaproteobacteria bacterium]|nr:tRNA lysidine(34) synthetase TilS [Deltaproteobacteria bacterium]